MKIHFSDELEDHAREQMDAMKNLYLKQPSCNVVTHTTAATGTSVTPSMGRRRVSSSTLKKLVLSRRSSEIEEVSTLPNKKSLSISNLTFDYTTGNDSIDAAADKAFVIRRGLQVIGCASFNELSMSLTDVVVQQSCRRQGVGMALVNSVRSHLTGALKEADSGPYLTVKVKPIPKDSFSFFEHTGFAIEPAHATTLDGAVQTVLIILR
jgi:N-acetylglutamate synthase-like GNAT family acetyltransferase